MIYEKSLLIVMSRDKDSYSNFVSNWQCDIGTLMYTVHIFDL